MQKAVAPIAPVVHGATQRSGVIPSELVSHLRTKLCLKAEMPNDLRLREPECIDRHLPWSDEVPASCRLTAGRVDEGAALPDEPIVDAKVLEALLDNTHRSAGGAWKAVGSFQRPFWKAVAKVQRLGWKPIGRFQQRATSDAHNAILVVNRHDLGLDHRTILVHNLKALASLHRAPHGTVHLHEVF